MPLVLLGACIARSSSAPTVLSSAASNCNHCRMQCRQLPSPPTCHASVVAAVYRASGLGREHFEGAGNDGLDLQRDGGPKQQGEGE